MRAFLRTAQGRDVRSRLDRGEARIYGSTGGQQLCRDIARQQGIGPRQSLPVGQLARCDHRRERVHALIPVLERAAEVGQVAVILQSLLKIIFGQQAVQVARLRRTGQLPELPEPSLLIRLLVGTQKILEHMSFADLRYRRIDALRLRVEGGDRRFVELGGLCVRVELAVGVGYGEIRFLHRGVEEIAVVQFGPGRECLAVLAQRGVCPSHPQQCTGRIRTGEAHPVERDTRRGGIFGLQPGIAERQIRLVAQCEHFAAGHRHRTDRGQHRRGLLHTILAHQRDTEVEAGEGHPVRRTLPMRQQRRRLVEAVLAHEHVDQQVLALRLERRRQLTADMAERQFAAIVIAARVPDLGEIEPGTIAQRGGNLVRQERFEAPACLVVHAERQVHATGQERRVLLVMRHAVPVFVGLETRQCLELIAGVETEQHVTVMQVLHADGAQRVGHRGRRRPRGRHRDHAAER